jgi:gentisate 1,2-dioxygenase
MNRMTKRTQPEQPGAMMPATERTDWARFMTDDEYYPFLVKRDVRPALWRWRDLEPRLAAVAKDRLRRADRRFIALVNSDTGEAGGVLPSLFLGIQIINPGEHILPHRHNSYALYHIIRGVGFSIVGEHKFEWSRGDTFACSPWASHEHVNTGGEPAIQYVVQDMPARAMERNLMWEEPIGRMFHMIEGNLPHTK